MNLEYIQAILPALLKGTWQTLQVFFLTLVLSLPLGLPFALGSISRFFPVRFLSKAYIWVFRGTPLMLQLFFVYYGLPIMFGPAFRMENTVAAVLTFTMNYAAYFAEIYRAGIESIPVGQYEAAEVLGYSKAQTFVKIILPQVVKRVLPPVTNETITLVKDTSMAFTISIAEMFTVAKQIGAAQTSVLPLLAAGVFYYIFNLVVASFMEYLEKKTSYYR